MEINQINIIQSSVLYIVVITTVFFGTAMPFFINFQLKDTLPEQFQLNQELIPSVSWY